MILEVESGRRLFTAVRCFKVDIVELHSSDIDDNTRERVLRGMCNLPPNTATTVNKTPPSINNKNLSASARYSICLRQT